MYEEMIVRYCSPTLAGIKTGNMFSCNYESVKELMDEIRKLNRRLTVKGLRILPLRVDERIALIYVYRPSKLKIDLLCDGVSELLEQFGYVCNMPDECVVRLISRLQEQAEFPHEIGLFLGYPLEDVKGFIENKARYFKCAGYWKVYGDEQKAKELFDRYEKCTDNYIRLLTYGNTIERITVGA